MDLNYVLFFLLQDGRIRGAGARRKFMLNLGACRAQIQAAVETAEFGTLYSALQGVVDLTDCSITYKVVQRFWDTISTFHLPFGKMTITLCDFVVLLGLSFTG